MLWIICPAIDSTIDASQMTSIANELHRHLNQLRKLKRNYIGSINRGKAIVNARIDSMEDGPFDCEQHFDDLILGDVVESAPDLLRHYAKFALIDDHEIVFTHSDLSPRNILVENGHVTAILDWEFAGWLGT